MSWTAEDEDREDAASETVNPPTYLGDGLYGSYDGMGYTLSAEREGGEHWVYLEADVLGNFFRFIERSEGVRVVLARNDKERPS